MMKLVMIAYNEAVDAEIMEALERLGITGFTKWTQVKGSGTSGGPHLGSNVWPKANNVLMACVPEDVAGRVVQEVRNLRQSIGHQGIKAFVIPVEELT